MRDLDKRLRLLESWMKPGGCLECECERLNTIGARRNGPLQACRHSPGLTLLDALRALNAEAPYAKP